MVRGETIYKEIIRRYISNMRPTDIKNYANNQRIIITDQETLIFFNFIKKYWEDILNDNTNVFSILKKQIRPDLYNKALELYKENKKKYL